MAKYFIQRKVDDVFSVVFKPGCTKGKCKPSCNDLSADETSSPENFTYTCSCEYSSGTFLPEKGKCVNEKEASDHLKGAFVSTSN